MRRTMETAFAACCEVSHLTLWRGWRSRLATAAVRQTESDLVSSI